MHKAWWDSICFLYDDKQITYPQLLVAARKAEPEVLEGKEPLPLLKLKLLILNLIISALRSMSSANR